MQWLINRKDEMEKWAKKKLQQDLKLKPEIIEFLCGPF